MSRSADDSPADRGETHGRKSGAIEFWDTTGGDVVATGASDHDRTHCKNTSLGIRHNARHWC